MLRIIPFLGFFGVVLLISVVTQVTSLSFCGNTYSIPEGCVAKSNHHIICDEYEMVWFYTNKKELSFIANETMRKLELKRYQPKKEVIRCFITGAPVDAIKITSKTHGCELLAYGIVNEHPVIVRVWLQTEPHTNAEIPEGVREFLRFTQ